MSEPLPPLFADGRSIDTTVLRWAVGAELPPLTLEPITRLQLIRYAGASGDYNPIHTIDEAAAEAGLPGVIAHGMLTMATLGRLFSPYLERGTLRRFETRFTGMVSVGDTITATGRVTGGVPDAEGTLYTVEISAATSAIGSLPSGEAAFLVYGQP